MCLSFFLRLCKWVGAGSTGGEKIVMAEKLYKRIPSRIKKPHIISTILLLFLFILSHADVAFGWHDETHLAVAQAAGYHKWYNTTGPDIAKIKAGTIERHNHYYGNPFNREVTPEMVLRQVMRYNNPNHKEGHLYGAIIASLRDYVYSSKKGKYAEYHIAFCAHYMADLSQPLHNIPYDDFNQKHHVTNDGIVEDEVLRNISQIKKNMGSVSLSADNFEKDLAKEIARIANNARHLGYKLKKENRNMTKEEAYKQLGKSASLIHAVLHHLGKIKQ